MSTTQTGVNEKLERQCKLELDGFDEGVIRYLHNMEKTYNNKDKDNTVMQPDHKMMVSFINEVSTNLKRKLIGGVKTNPLNYKLKAFYSKFDPDRLAFITLRYCLNCDPKRNALVPLCVGLGKHIKKDYEYLQFQEKAPAYLSQVERNLLSSHLSHRQKVLDHAIQKVEYEEDGKKIKGIKTLKWDLATKFNYGKFLIECVTETKLKMFKIGHECKMKRISNAKYGFAGQANFLTFNKTQACMDILEAKHLELAEFSPLVYPCIVPPKPWNGVRGGGFHTQYKSLRTKLIRTHNKNALKIAEKFGVEQLTDAINTIQNTKYRINKRVLDVMKEGRDSTLGGLPPKDKYRVEVNGHYPLEEDSPWTDQEFKQLKKEGNMELLRWIAEKAIAHDLWNRNQSKRQALLMKLKIAEMFKDEPELYFIWNIDYRGRMYCYQPYINPQMDDSGKALLEFAESKPLGDHGFRHLCIHGANVFGYDKAPLDDRVQWVKDHHHEIINSAENPVDGMKFWCDADKPYCFLAFCFEYAEAHKDPKGFESRIPVQQDGTCSGLQHYSALLRDNVGAKVVNLVPAAEKADVYGEVAEIVNQMLEDDVKKGGEKGKFAKAWLEVGVDRKICKRNVMTFCYGATRTGFTQQLIDHILKEGIRLSIKQEFQACNYLGGLNWSAIEQTLVKSVEAMEFLQKIAFFMAKNGLDICWTNGVNLRVNQDYLKTKTKQIKTYWGETRIDPRIAVSTDEKNAVGSRNGIAPNFIHSLDASHLMLTAQSCSEEGIDAFAFIHDSFGTHAGSMETMSRVLRETFVEMYSEDLMEKFVGEVRLQIPDDLLEEFDQIVADYKPQMGSLDVTCVQRSPYFFS